MEYEKWDEVLAPYNNAVEELKVKFKNIIMVIISVILSLNGLIFSKPKFLFEE